MLALQSRKVGRRAGQRLRCRCVVDRKGQRDIVGRALGKRNLSKRGRIYETATENQKRLWIGEKHADEFEIVDV